MEDFSIKLARIYEQRFEPTKESIEQLKEYVKNYHWNSMEEMVTWLLSKGYEQGLKRSIKEYEAHKHDLVASMVSKKSPKKIGDK